MATAAGPALGWPVGHIPEGHVTVPADLHGLKALDLDLNCWGQSLHRFFKLSGLEQVLQPRLPMKGHSAPGWSGC